MDLLSAVQKSITAVLVTVALAVVLGELLGQPVLLGYVETGSMVPTIEVGDGFIAMPTSLAGDIDQGTVVTYRAQDIGGGGLTTHRIEKETPQGYITKGDGNGFTDQAAGEPPVQDGQIVAVALEIGGDVVVLPAFGKAALFIQNIVTSAVGLVGISGGGIGATTTGFGVVLIVASLVYGFFESEGRSTERSTGRSGSIQGSVILIGVIVVLCLPLLTNMAAASDTSTMRIVSADNPQSGIVSQVKVGESKEVPYRVRNQQFLPKVVILESEGAGIEFTKSVIPVSHGEEKRVGLVLSAPDENGVYTRSRSEHQYIHALPVPVIVALHGIHPFVAMGAVSLTATAPFIVLYLLMFGLQPISVRSTQR